MTPRFAPLADSRVQVKLSKCHSPPYTSISEPALPPNQLRTDAGTLVENVASPVLVVLMLKSPAYVASKAHALVAVSAVNPFGMMYPLKSYEMCCAYIVQMPFNGLVMR